MKIGLIGCGRAARIHMDVYKYLSDVKVIGVSDIDQNKSKAFAKFYNIDKVFPTYKDLIETKDLDLIDICTPTSTHATLSCEAAKLGHNILIEKPMARNTEECERIIKESEKHKVKVCVCHNQLYYPFVKQLKNIADSEEFGLISFRTIHKENFEFLKTHGLATEWNIASEQGGILWEVGCHLAYLQLHFLEDVKEVYAVGTRAKYPVYDEFYVILCAPSQRYGIIEVSWIAKEPEIMYEINGSDGRRVQAYLPHGYIIEKSNEAISSIVDVFRSFYLDQKRILKKWVKFGLNRVIRRPYGGHFDLIRSYIESIKKDQPPPVTAADGRNTIKLLESIEQSLNERRSVAVTITK